MYNENIRCLKKTSLCQNWPWQILLLAVRNPYETLGNTSKTPSPSLTTSKCASTCDEFFPNCFVVFQARCCILLPKIMIPEQRCLQGRNSVSLSDPFLQWSSTGGGVPKTFCLGSRQIIDKGSCHLRFSGIRPLRGYPPPPLNGKSV